MALSLDRVQERQRMVMGMYNTCTYIHVHLVHIMCHLCVVDALDRSDGVKDVASHSKKLSSKLVTVHCTCTLLIYSYCLDTVIHVLLYYLFFYITGLIKEGRSSHSIDAAIEKAKKGFLVTPGKYR